MGPDPQETVDWVIFNEENLNEKLYFLCSVLDLNVNLEFCTEFLRYIPICNKTIKDQVYLIFQKCRYSSMFSNTKISTFYRKIDYNRVHIYFISV